MMGSLYLIAAKKGIDRTGKSCHAVQWCYRPSFECPKPQGRILFWVQSPSTFQSIDNSYTPSGDTIAVLAVRPCLAGGEHE